MSEQSVPARERAADEPVVRYAVDPRAERPPGRGFKLLSSGLGSMVPVVVVLALWQAGSMAGLIDKTFFPAPSECVQALVDLFSSGELLPNVGITAQRILLGFLLGVIPATLLGIAMGRSRWVRVLIDPLIAITYPIPVVAILPLLLVIFGTGGRPIVVLAGIISFFPAVVNAMSGVLQVDERLILMARNLGAGRSRSRGRSLPVRAASDLRRYPAGRRAGPAGHHRR